MINGFGPILPTPEVQIEDILKYLTYILIPILVISSFLIVFLLKKQITYKTKELSLANTKLSESQQRLALAMEFANDGLFDWNRGHQRNLLFPRLERLAWI